MNDLNNLANCCRLCLNQTVYLSVFDSNYDYLQQKILACLNIEVREFDKISIMICQRCLLKIEDFYEYRILCQKSQYTLFNWLNSYEGHSTYPNISSEIQIDEDHNFVDNVQIKQEPLPAPEDIETLNEEPLTVEDCPYEYVDVSQNFTTDFYRNSTPISTETLQMVESDNFLVPSSECEVSNHGVDDDTICPICKKKFCSSSSRFRHEKTVHKENQNEFLEPLNLKPKDSNSATFLNTTKIDPLNYIPCKYCPKNFKKRLNLLKHEKTVHKNKKTRKLYIRAPNPDPKATNDPLNVIYICNFCPKTFMSLENQIEHEKSHVEQNFEPRAKIQKLGKSNNPNSKTSNFGPDTRSGSLGLKTDQIDSKMSNLNKKLMNDFSRNAENLLQRNLRENLGSGTSKSDKHLLTEDELKFSCKSCDKSFKNKKALIWHEEHFHRKIRLNISLTCSFCPKIFRNLGNKLQHEKFKHKKELARRRQIEKLNEIPKTVPIPVPKTKIETETVTTDDVQEFPFPCKLCPKKYALSKSRRRHERIHHGMLVKQKNEPSPINVSDVSEIPENTKWGVKLTFDCKICLRKFRTLQKLLSHEKHYHKNEPEPEPELEREPEPEPEPKNGLLQILDPISEISCQFCHQKFTASSSRKRHEKYCDKKQKIPKIKIKGVPTLIETETLLHQDEGLKIETESYSKPKSKILKPKSKFKCQICSKSFKNYKNKRSHERSHKVTKRPSLRSNVSKVSEDKIPDPENSESPNNDSLNDSLTNETKPSLRYFRSKRAINSENQFNPALKRSKSDCSEPNEGNGDTNFENNENLDGIEKSAELLKNSGEKRSEKFDSEKSQKGSETLNLDETQGSETLNLDENQGLETLKSNENKVSEILNSGEINRSKALSSEENFTSKTLNVSENKCSELLNLNENQGSESLSSEEKKRSESSNENNEKLSSGMLNLDHTKRLEPLFLDDKLSSESLNLYENRSPNSDEYLHLASFNSEQYKRSESSGLKLDKNLHSDLVILVKNQGSESLNSDENQALESLNSDENQGSESLNLGRNQASKTLNLDENQGSESLNLDRNRGSESLISDENQGLESLNLDKNQGSELSNLYENGASKSLNSDENQGSVSLNLDRNQGSGSLESDENLVSNLLNSDKNQASKSLNSDESQTSKSLNLDENNCSKLLNLEKNTCLEALTQDENLSKKSLNSDENECSKSFNLNKNRLTKPLDIHENKRSEFPNLDKNKRSEFPNLDENQHLRFPNMDENQRSESLNLNECQDSKSLNSNENLLLKSSNPDENLPAESLNSNETSELLKVSNLNKTGHFEAQFTNLGFSKDKNLNSSENNLGIFSSQIQKERLNSSKPSILVENDKKLSCKICNNLFSTLSEWVEHQKIHLKCYDCSESFTSSVAFFEHQKHHRKDKKIDIHSCQSCHKNFKSSNSLYFHCKKHHLSKSIPNLNCFDATLKVEVKNQNSVTIRPRSALGRLTETFKLDEIDKKFYQNDPSSPLEIDSCQNVVGSSIKNNRLSQNRSISTLGRGSRTLELNVNEKKVRDPYVNSCYKMSETVRNDRSIQKRPISALGGIDRPDHTENKLLFESDMCQEMSETVTNEMDRCQRMSESIKNDRLSQKRPITALGGIDRPDQTEDKLLFDNKKGEEMSETVTNDIDTCQKVSVSVNNEKFQTSNSSTSYYVPESKNFVHQKKFSSKSEPDLDRSSENVNLDFDEALRNQGFDNDRLSSSLKKSSASFRLNKNDIIRDKMSFFDNDSCQGDIGQNKRFDYKFSSLKIYNRHFSRSEPDLSAMLDTSVTFDRSRPPMLENMAKCQNCDFLASSPIQLDAHLRGCKIDSSLNRSMPDLTKFDDEKSFQLKVIEKKF